MVRTRFAPSPTGFLHIGSLRTALYSYALAKHSHGNFLLRIEDTDQKREVAGALEGIFSTLNKFGIKWDEEPTIQSQRAKEGVYIQAAEKLISSGKAFYCQCEARNAKIQGFSQILRDPCRDKNLHSGAVKLKIPDSRKVTYHDFVLDKNITWDTNTVADTTILKSDSMDRLPTYHLAVVVDDVYMQISHALRGHDWLPSTPIHLLIYEFLGYKLSELGHLTDIQSPKGGKLSKRRDSVFCEKFIEDGYLPEALLNFVMLLGWAPKDNRELFTLEEFVQKFDPNGFQKSNPLFTFNKLEWFNGHYIRQKTDTELVHLVKPHVKNNLTDTKLVQIIPLIKDRLVKLSDIDSLTGFFINSPQINLSLFHDPSSSFKHLSSTLNCLSSIDPWTKENIETDLKALISSQGFKVGDFFMSLRIAICGSRQTPPITDTMVILGKNESLKRIRSCMSLLDAIR